MLIVCLSKCVVIIGFRAVGERYVLAKYTHRSVLPSPMYLAHTYTVSLSKMIPAGFLLITTYSRLG